MYKHASIRLHHVEMPRTDLLDVVHGVDEAEKKDLLAASGRQVANRVTAGNLGRR